MPIKDKKKLQIQIDKDLYNQVEAVLNDIGLTQTGAINAYFKKIASTGGIPFELKQTDRQRASQELYNTLKDRPSKEIKTTEELEAWLDEE